MIYGRLSNAAVQKWLFAMGAYEQHQQPGLLSHAVFRVLLTQGSFIENRENVLKGCHHDPDQPGVAEAVCQ